jgi:flagellar basal-body rod modification protein FlgD
VGQNVLIEGNTLSRSNGVASGAIDLGGQADNVKVEILSPGGQVLDTLNLGAKSTGRHTFDWDASAYTGTGEPSYRVTATQGGNAISTTALVRDMVTSVSSENGVMTVQLQGRGAVAYSNVKAIL